ncbi:tyrosine-type recombinase/integrase [Flexivirga caeni]|uniref:Recombinase XerD n=1 Tax=Flexivirga caeni TaxID=2294115 RepID=A0A3M9LZB9_9MICO|nr:tyrosine-type recombinase/integrase [Flexivirga caeni]RNI18327.1 recombinase XerD [Flexivirga caeni]
MTVRKTPSGRWRGVLKVGREQVASKTFDTRAQAVAWIDRERAAIAGGVDPRAGKATVRALLPQWFETRANSVAGTTYKTDQRLLKALPAWFVARGVNSLTDREVQRVLVEYAKAGRVRSSTVRYRAALSSFFSWCVRERLIATNPVVNTRVPRQTTPRVEMRPFTEAELESVSTAVAGHDERLARLVLIAGWTGLRWSELRAMRVRSLVEVPLPLLIVERAAPEGVEVKTTKSGRVRRVPIADRVLPLVREFAAGKSADELLFTTASGHQLHVGAFKRATDWKKTGRGHRVYDLRHTAACLWLVRGVDPTTVKAWMGHASMATTNLYIHHLGTAADRAALDRLNGPGCAGGAPISTDDAGQGS